MDEDYDSEENVLLFETTYASLIARIAAGFFGQLLFYPVETIVHRLHVQGVRAIIDNTDTGVGVLPINSSIYYTDFWSCFKSIEEAEGSSGLYKGVGCVLLKFSLLYGGMLLAHGRGQTIRHGEQILSSIGTKNRRRRRRRRAIPVVNGRTLHFPLFVSVNKSISFKEEFLSQRD